MLIKISNRNKTFIQFHLSEIEYQKAKLNNKEICIAGKMYDVQSIKKQENIYIVSAIKDTEEENLIYRFCNLIKSNKKENKNLSNILEKYFLPFI